MRKTILKEYLIYKILSTIIISIILSSLICIYNINKLKNNILLTTEFLNEETNINNEKLFALLSNLNLNLEVSQNIDLYDDTLYNKNFNSFGKYIITTTSTLQNYDIKITGFINIFNIYLYTTLILFVLNYISAFIYAKSLNKNVILPISNLCKNKIKGNFKFDEIESLSNYIEESKKSFITTINKLKVENKKIEYILDNMSEGFLLLDKNLNVLTINKSAKKILNCKEKAGKNIFHYTQNIKIINPIEKAIKENKNVNFDISLKNKKIYSTYVDKAKKENSNSYEYIIFMVDVTVERQNQRLKQELFSNISHELKTPITSIKGYAELLQNDFAKNKEQNKEFLERIEKETQNIHQLINDILTISKLENKAKNLDTDNINIHSLVEEISKSLMPIYKEKNIIVENNCEEIIIKANYQNFYKLFNNLILNAIKYNNKNGYVKVYFKEQNEYFELIVKDSGVGIPAEDKNRIFERFYRVEKKSHKNNVTGPGGSGLGLAIVKYIVKLYNGKIKVKSRLGNGSTFNIKLPKNKLM